MLCYVDRERGLSNFQKYDLTQPFICIGSAALITALYEMMKELHQILVKGKIWESLKKVKNFKFGK